MPGVVLHAHHSKTNRGQSRRTQHCYRRSSCIAAIHDPVGLWRAVTLTVALPVISATGVDVRPHSYGRAPKTRTRASSPAGRSATLSDDMLPIAHHWQRIGARIDGVYSGYLASPSRRSCSHRRSTASPRRTLWS
ncbi:MAG: hypothetical protein ACLUNO_10755 [Oscillospiraceae bacterium]